MHLDDTVCRGAVRSRDARFDGFFYTAVLSTGIYCRPSCPARTPKDANMVFHASSASAQAAGFRACKRCRPDAVPGSPEWNVRSDTVARAMRLIADGVVDREGVPRLAEGLGYSVRQVERLLSDELGAGPARSRAGATRAVGTDPDRVDRSADVRYRVRRRVLVGAHLQRRAPGDLRDDSQRAEIGGRHRRPAVARRHRHPPSAGVPGAARPVEPARAPHRDGRARCRGVPRRGLPNDPATASRLGHRRRCAARSALLSRSPCGSATSATSRRPSVGCVVCSISTPTRWPSSVTSGRSAPSRCRRGGTRASGAAGLDPDAFALRAVLGQQVSTAAARTHAARLVRALGEPIVDPDGGLTHLFPTAEAVAGASREAASTGRLRVPASRRRTLLGIATALAEGAVDLDPGADWAEAAPHLDAPCPASGRGPSRRSPCAPSATPTPSSSAISGSSRRPPPSVSRRRARHSSERRARGRRGAPTPCSTSGRSSPHAVNSIPDDDVVLPPLEGPLRMTYTTIDSPIGELTLVADADSTALRALYMVDHRHAPGRRDLRRAGRPVDAGVFARRCRQLGGVLRRVAAHLRPRARPVGTDFQRAVWQQLALIPFGETRTYGEIAAALGNPKAVRAVGLANGRNPLSHHRAVPPRHRGERRDDRLRRRRRAQGVPARRSRRG